MSGAFGSPSQSSLDRRQLQSFPIKGFFVGPGRRKTPKAQTPSTLNPKHPNTPRACKKGRLCNLWNDTIASHQPTLV